MSTTSVVGRGGVDNLEMNTFISDSIASRTPERKADVITAWVSPNIDTVENNPAEKPRKGRKRNAVCAFFKRMCKAVKDPFLGCDSNRVMCLTPQLNPHLDDPELMHIPVSSRKTAVTDPEPPSLPGQVCVDHELLPVPGPSGIQQTPEGDSADPEPSTGPSVNKQIADVDPADPDPACVPGASGMKQTPDTDPAVPKPVFVPGSTHVKMNYRKPTKWRKKAICAFFKRVCKTLKRPFCCCDQNRVVRLTPQSDPHPDPHPEDPELIHIPGPSSIRKTADTEPSSLPGPVCADLDSLSVPSTSVIKQTADTDLGDAKQVSVASPTHLKMTYGSVVSDYEVGRLKSSGCFGMVYEGTRISNREKVAIKHIPKCYDDRYLVIPGHPEPLLAEVAMMLKLSEPPISPNVIQLYEWFEDLHCFALIMEYPQPCKTLMDCLHEVYPDYMSEKTACDLMFQAVNATKYCIDRGVFHSDLHPANFLICGDSWQLKLIDFGCGQLFSGATCKSSEYQGAPAYCPPEVKTRPRYWPVQAIVWSLGVLLFKMVHGYVPFRKKEDILRADFDIRNSSLSKECRRVICQCLTLEPALRLNLEQLLDHEWFEHQVESRRGHQ